MSRSFRDERGLAMVFALFMVAVLSVLGTSLMFVSQTETWSSLNYRLTSQARYAAESGVHRAAHYLLHGGYVPPTNMAAFDLSVSPVEFNNAPVVLSSNPDVPSNYPDPDVESEFEATVTGTMDVTNGTVDYVASARLLSMRTFFDEFAAETRTIQTWEITGVGIPSGPREARVEVSAVIEQQTTPVFNYAAFATFNGCAALSFAGGATTDSYNSNIVPPVFTPSGGNVGTNGNLTEVGNPTTIYGSLSSPRAGVGACTSNNVTAQTVSGQASVEEGLIQLPQAIEFPTPPPPDPMPPTNSYTFQQSQGCPGGMAAPLCTKAGNVHTLDPAGGTIVMGNVSLSGNARVVLKSGTYIVNSLDIAGNSQIAIEEGHSVVFQIAGQGMSTPLKIAGNGISNPSFKPSNLRFVYAGTGNVQVAGGTDTAALLYAPNATGSFAGGSDWYGAVIMRQITATGGASIHYDVNLKNDALTVGNHMMSAFTWRSF